MKQKLIIMGIEGVFGIIVLALMFLVSGGVRPAVYAAACATSADIACCDNSGCPSGETCFSAGTISAYCQINYNGGGNLSGGTSSGGTTAGTPTGPSGCTKSASVACCSNADCSTDGSVLCYGGGGTIGAYCQTNYSGVGTSGGNSGLPGSGSNNPPCTSMLTNNANISCIGNGCSLDANGQTCSVRASLPPPAANQAAACSTLAASSLGNDLQQNVTGSGPISTTRYNSAYYATSDAAALLAQCLGGSVVLTSAEAANSPFYIPPTYQIVLPNGVQEIAGALIQQLLGHYSGNLSNWQNFYVNALRNPGPGSQAPGALTTLAGHSVIGSTNLTTAGGNGNSSNANNSIAAVIGGLEHSILTYRVSAAAQLQAQTNAAIGNGNTGAITSQTTATQGLLAALRSSLQNISSSLTTGTVSPSILTSVSSVLTSIAQIIQSLQGTTSGIVSGGTIGTGSGTQGGTLSGGVAFIPGSFRYLKIQTTEQGWVSWREIEVYDSNNQKLNVATATASAVYDGTWQNPHVAPQVATNAIDGNSSTVWNAGETNPDCNQGIYGASCPTSSRSAYIILDLGSVKNVSRIRLQENGNTTTEVDVIQTSSDGVSYDTVATLRAPFSDSQWIEYPSPALTISGATNGIFLVGQPWTLMLSSNVSSTPFSLCAIHPNGTQDCTAAGVSPGGTTDANGGWTSTGSFNSSTIGSWSEWVMFPTKNNTTSSRAMFTVR